MTQQHQRHSYSLDELQRLCDECKLAINQQPDVTIRQAMVTVCDRCKKVKSHVPELVKLRKHIHEMNEKLADDLA